MKMSVRSIISNAVVACIVLASTPVVAMQPGQQQAPQQQAPQQPQQAPEQQAQQPEKGNWFSNGIRNLAKEADEFQKNHIPDIAGGVDKAVKKVDSEAREIAQTSMGPVFFGLVGAAIGLFACYHLTKDKSGVGILDQFLGFMKGIFGDDRYNAMTDRGFEAVAQNDGFKPVMNAAQWAHTAKKTTGGAKEQINKGADWLDGFSDWISTPFKNLREWWNSSPKPAQPQQPAAANNQQPANNDPAQQPAPAQAAQQPQQNNNAQQQPQSTGQSADGKVRPSKKGVLGEFDQQQAQAAGNANVNQ